MPGLGTIINVAAIVVAGLLGAVAGKLLNERLQDGLAKAAGVCVLFIGAAGALQGMLAVEGGSLIAGQSLFVVIRPFMTDPALAGLSLVGSILIFCVGINLVWDTKLRVANMLPAIIVAPLLTFLPVAW